MANQYLDTSYVDAYLGAGVRAALFTDSLSGVYSAADFNALAKAATSVIETALRNSGYTPPVATVGTASTVDEYVRLATYGAFLELAASRPEHRLRLDDMWEKNPANLAYRAIIDGDANLSLTLVVKDAIGGAVFSEQSEDVTSEDGSRPHTFSRKGLQGY